MGCKGCRCARCCVDVRGVASLVVLWNLDPPNELQACRQHLWTRPKESFRKFRKPSTIISKSFFSCWKRRRHRVSSSDKTSLRDGTAGGKGGAGDCGEGGVGEGTDTTISKLTNRGKPTFFYSLLTRSNFNARGLSVHVTTRVYYAVVGFFWL